MNSAHERAHSFHAGLLQQERRPGAREFIGSRTIENDVPVPWNILQALLYLVRGDPHSAWNTEGLPVKFELVA